MLVTSCCAPALRAQVGLGLAPMRTEARIPPGGSHSGTLALTNESHNKVRVRAELLDFRLDEQANPQFHREIPSEAQYSCRSHLTLNPVELEIEAGATARVRYTLRVPAGASERSFHCAAGFLTLPPITKANGMGINTAVRIVTAFYAAVSNPTIQADLRGLRLETVNTGDAPAHQAVLAIKNAGTVYCRPSGTVAILGPDGKVLVEEPLPSFVVLPERSQTVPVRFTRPLPPGSRRLRARVDFGTGEVHEAEVNVTVPSTGAASR